MENKKQKKRNNDKSKTNIDKKPKLVKSVSMPENNTNPKRRRSKRIEELNNKNDEKDIEEDITVIEKSSKSNKKQKKDIPIKKTGSTIIKKIVENSKKKKNAEKIEPIKNNDNKNNTNTKSLPPKIIKKAKSEIIDLSQDEKVLDIPKKGIFNSKSISIPSIEQFLSVNNIKKEQIIINQYQQDMNFDYNGNKTTPEEAKDILTGIRAHGDEESQLMGVEQLKERILCAQSEEHLRIFNLDEFIPSLLDLLDLDYNGNILFATIVCLNYMMSNIPASISFIVKYDGVKKIVAKFQNIEYVDVAESAITTLHKISSENPELVLESGGISAVLNTMDFFHPGVISKAISTAANCCTSITLDNFDLIKSEVPTLMSLLHREEKTELETSILCFSNLIYGITNIRSVSGLETVAGKGLIRVLISLIQSYVLEGKNSRVSPKSYNLCLKIITICITNSSKLLEEVINQGIVNILSTAMEQLINSTSKESDPQIIVLLELTDRLFPELPIDYIPINHYEYYIPRRVRFPLNDPLLASKETLNIEENNTNQNELLETPTEVEIDDPQEIYCKKNTTFLLNLGTSIIKHLIKFYTSIVNADVHDRSLILILKFIYFSSSETLSELLREVPISNLLSNMLSAHEMHSKVIAILIANSLMEKLPDIFKKYFKREGVVHRIYQLSIDDELVNSVQKKIQRDEELRLQEIERKKKEEEEELRRQEEEKKRFEEEQKRIEEERLLEEEEQKRIEEEQKKLEEEQEKSEEEKKGFFKNLLQKKKTLKPVTKSKEVNKFVPLKNPIKNERKRAVKKPFQQTKQVPPKITNALDTQEWTYKSVIKFKDLYFPRKENESINDWLATEELKTLKALAEELRELVQKSSGIPSEKDVNCLIKLSSFLSSGNLSEFELLSSGLISSVLCYLTHNSEDKEKNKEDRLDRLRLFSVVFLGLEFPDLQKRLNLENKTKGVEPIMLLINILQDILTQHEELAVFPHLGRNVHSMQGLFKKIPVRFEKDNKETFLPVLENKIGSVDLLATTKDLINYICLQLEVEKQQKEELEKKKLPVHQKLMNAIKEKTSKLKSSTTSTPTSNSPPKTTLTKKISNLFSKKSSSEKVVEITPTNIEDENQDEKQDLEDEDEQEIVEEVNNEEQPPQNEYNDNYNEEEEEQPQDEQPLEDLPQDNVQTSEDQLERYRRLQNKQRYPRNILVFFGDQQLNEGDTIFKSLRNFEEKQIIKKADFIFTTESVLTYKRIDDHSDLNFSSLPETENQTNTTSNLNKSGSNIKIESNTEKVEMNNKWEKYQQHSFDSILDQKHSIERLDKIVLESISLLSIFRLLSTQYRDLYTTHILQSENLISEDIFLNKKLSSMVKEQLDDPISVSTQSYPFWVNFFMKHSSFLFPYPLRHKYFESKSFGIARTLANMEILPLKGKREFVEGNEFALDYPLIHKEKVRISKHKILKTTQVIMEIYGHSKSNLEISYFGQEGIGLGPTKQYYTTLSQKLQKKKHGLWLDSGDNKESKYVTANGGLFPSPFNVTPKVLKLFELIGTISAKAIVDNRIFNLPFSLAFLKLAIGNEKLNWDEIKNVVSDKKYEFYKNLNECCLKKKAILNDPLLNEKEKEEKIKSISYCGISIDDLCLDWKIDGSAGEMYELKKGGKDLEFNDINEADEYLGESIDAYLGKGIEKQVQAFRKGFSKVFQIENLSHFKTKEVYEMLCGTFDDPNLWSIKELQQACLVKHGFNPNDKVILTFYKVVSELSNEDKSKFLTFVTGCPRLPIGGFRSLHPQLTIVKKDVPSYAADYTLLSVMTCTNYIKLPEYTSEEIMIDKIKTAISMSSGFYLT
eukprot:TRINITY_DN1664_c0_g5_i1.p1 TRINITY_DN1664_c0_g5~~TRINITY_DN1664_c0_g5_i1.p1  ORF type:complete len:1844 (+),score=682.30 TRINITY_DN1664_c0_g5_i1:44-5533(+)